MTEEILTAAGVQHRQARFPKPPAGTYAVFFDDIDRDVADRVTHSVGGRLPGIYHHAVSIEVYEPTPDDNTEAAIEAELDARELPWSKEDRYWMQDVQRYQVLYEFTYTSKNR